MSGVGYGCGLLRAGCSEEVETWEQHHTATARGHSPKTPLPSSRRRLPRCHPGAHNNNHQQHDEWGACRDVSHTHTVLVWWAISELPDQSRAETGRVLHTTSQHNSYTCNPRTRGQADKPLRAVVALTSLDMSSCDFPDRRTQLRKGGLRLPCHQR